MYIRTHRSEGWWPRPWPKHRSLQPSKTYTTSWGALLFSPLTTPLQRRRTRWAQHLLSYRRQKKVSFSRSKAVLCFGLITQRIPNKFDSRVFKIVTTSMSHCENLKATMCGEVNCALCVHESAAKILLTGSIGFSITLQVSWGKLQLLN